MKFEEAFPILRRGGRIARKAWLCGEYLQKLGDQIVENNNRPMDPGNDYFADDWQEWVDPVEAKARELYNLFIMHCPGMLDSWEKTGSRYGWMAIAQKVLEK